MSRGSEMKKIFLASFFSYRYGDFIAKTISNGWATRERTNAHYQLDSIKYIIYHYEHSYCDDGGFCDISQYDVASDFKGR